MHLYHLTPAILLTTMLLLALASPPSMAQVIPDARVPGGNREDDEAFKRAREEWIESMHRAEPGVDHRIIDREVREARHEHGWASMPKVKAGTWMERGSDNLAGRMHTADVDFDRGRIYAASAGGNLWRGTLGGSEWTSLTDPMKRTITLVRLIPHNGAQRILIAGGGGRGVYHSDDDGATWTGATGLENIANWGEIRRTVVANDAEHRVYVLAKEWDYKDWGAVMALYVSTDHGTTFQQMLKRRLTSLQFGTCDIWAARYDRADVWLAIRDTLSMITPDGMIRHQGIITLDGDYGAVSDVQLQGSVQPDATTLYLLCGVSGSSQCWRTTDEGASWTLQGRVTDVRPFSINSFAVSTLDPSTLYLGGVETFRSVDAGVTWHLVNKWGEYYADPVRKLHADIPGIMPFRQPGGGELTLIATDGGLYRSTDNLRTVTNIGQRGLNVSQYYSVLTNRTNTSIVYAGSQDQGFQRAITGPDQKYIFTQLISGDYGHLSSSNGGRNLWSVYPGFILYYPNSEEASPASANHWSFDNRGSLWLPPIVADPEDVNSAYVAVGGTSSQSKITHVSYIRSTNTIEGTELGFDFSEGTGTRVSAIACSPHDESVLYVATNAGGFFSTSDGGSTWNKAAGFTGPGGHYFYGSSILPSVKKRGWIMIAGSGYSNPAVFVSTDNGATFEDSLWNDGLPKTLIFQLAMTTDEQFIFAATEVGPYMFSMADRRWIDISGGVAPDQTYWTVEYIPSLRTARFGTYGRGIWDYTLDSPSAVAGIPAAPAAIHMGLHPNPSPAETMITFDLPKHSDAALRIYDMQGRVVRTLVDGPMAAGSHSVAWDGRSSGGHALPAGSYLCIVRVNDQVGCALIRRL